MLQPSEVVPRSVCGVARGEFPSVWFQAQFPGRGAEFFPGGVVNGNARLRALAFRAEFRFAGNENLIHAGGRAARLDVADQGLLFCWTGTGVSIAANKVPGIRAALCSDAETARGARRWNDANVLCMSLRLTAPTVAEEIIDAWLAAEIDESERANIDKVKAIDADGSD